MQCTLYIPHLIPPRDAGDALWRSVDAPQLKTLLARAAYIRDKHTSNDALLCDTFGVEQQPNNPLAPLLVSHQGVDASSDYWLCATPVHLETRRNALVLADATTLGITAAESAAFVATLAEHLREEGLTLHAPQPDQWYLRSNITPAITTASLSSVTGRDVRPFLPKGTDSARWHRVLTEIQMLLHTHPANDAREARGMVPVNSVWLWGGGTLPAAVSAPFVSVWSDDAVMRALAHHSGCGIAPCPAVIDPATLEGGAHLFSYESLTPLLRLGNTQAWCNAVTALNQNWLIPLMDMLKSRRLSTLTLVCSDGSDVMRFVIHSGDLFKIWRKNRYLQ